MMDFSDSYFLEIITLHTLKIDLIDYCIIILDFPLWSSLRSIWLYDLLINQLGNHKNRCSIGQ